MTTQTHDDLRQAVRETYAAVAEGEASSCGCSTSSCCGTAADLTAAGAAAIGYSEQEVSAVPKGADMGLGCGNPQAIAGLEPGQIVLDLGSGGGIDCFLAARAVGEAGRVIGVDMTPEMIGRARRIAEEVGATNVEFRLGEIEALPVGDDSTDVIISNCVVNLSPQKPRVFAEAFRVLKPGGRLAVADIVATRPLPDKVRADLALYAGCVSGAAVVADLVAALEEAGFVDIRITPLEQSRDAIRAFTPDNEVADFVVSATIEAVKP